MKNTKIRRGRKNNTTINITRQFIEEAMDHYFNHGGKITKIEFDEKSYRSFMKTTEAPSAVDDFLSGVV